MWGDYRSRWPDSGHGPTVLCIHQCGILVSQTKTWMLQMLSMKITLITNEIAVSVVIIRGKSEALSLTFCWKIIECTPEILGVLVHKNKDTNIIWWDKIIWCKGKWFVNLSGSYLYFHKLHGDVDTLLQSWDVLVPHAQSNQSVLIQFIIGSEQGL